MSGGSSRSSRGAGVALSVLGVLSVLLVVELLLQFHGSFVVLVVLVGNSFFANRRVEEIFVNGLGVEVSVLGRQGMLEVLRAGQVLLDGILVELVVLVFQSLDVVFLFREVSLGLLAVSNALRCFVILTFLVSEGLLQVAGVVEELGNRKFVQFALLVRERLAVNSVVLQLFEGSFPGGNPGLVNLNQFMELGTLVFLNFGVVTFVSSRHGCLGGLRTVGGRVGNGVLGSSL